MISYHFQLINHPRLIIERKIKMNCKKKIRERRNGNQSKRSMSLRFEDSNSQYGKSFFAVHVENTWNLGLTDGLCKSHRNGVDSDDVDVGLEGVGEGESRRVDGHQEGNGESLEEKERHQNQKIR